jgi:hypothetical protein
MITTNELVEPALLDAAYEAKESSLLRRMELFGKGPPGISINDELLLDRLAEFPEFTAIERDENGRPIACREIEQYPQCVLPQKIPGIPQKYLADGRVFQTYMLIVPDRRGKGGWTNLYPVAVQTLKKRLSGPGIILNTIDVPDTPKYHDRRLSIHNAYLHNGFTQFETLKGPMYYLKVTPYLLP